MNRSCVFGKEEKVRQAEGSPRQNDAYFHCGKSLVGNAWLYGTPYEIASYCIKNGMKVVGHSTDITPKTVMFSGDTLDVGVCAEYEDGERFWCHYRSENIKEMIELY